MNIDWANHLCTRSLDAMKRAVSEIDTVDLELPKSILPQLQRSEENTIQISVTVVVTPLATSVAIKEEKVRSSK